MARYRRKPNTYKSLRKAYDDGSQTLHDIAEEREKILKRSAAILKGQDALAKRVRAGHMLTAAENQRIHLEQSELMRAQTELTSLNEREATTLSTLKAKAGKADRFAEKSAQQIERFKQSIGAMTRHQGAGAISALAALLCTGIAQGQSIHHNTVFPEAEHQLDTIFNKFSKGAERRAITREAARGRILHNLPI